MKTMSACKKNVFLVKEHKYGGEFGIFRFIESRKILKVDFTKSKEM